MITSYYRSEFKFTTAAQGAHHIIHLI